MSTSSLTLGAAARDCDALVTEIASGNGSIATIIRKIHENDVDFQTSRNPFLSSEESHKSAGETILPALLHRLDDKAESHTRAIEALCHQNFQSFSNSIRDLMQVKDNLEKLQGQLDQTSSAVNQSTQKLCTKVEAYESCQETLHNIDASIEALQLCLPILDQFTRVRRNIAENRFFPALKALGFLEHSQLPLISHFDFSNQLAAQIPDIRETIKNKSKDQHTDFLESVRKHSVRLGAMAMHHTARKTGLKLGNLLNTEPSHSARKKPATSGNPFIDGLENSESLEEDWQSLQRLHRNTKRGTNDNESSSTNDEEELDEEDCNIEDLVDFAPIYRCLHIHSVLGEKSMFEKHYRFQRKKQWQLCVNMSPGQQANLKNYSEFFSGLVGFFVVEDYIFHTIPGMTNKNYLDELWAETIQKLISILRANVEHVSQREQLLRLKDVCVVFTRTMQYLGFNTAGLKELFLVVRTRYHKLVADDQQIRFEEIFQSDDYSAVYLQTQEEYQVILDMYPCQSPEFDVLPYPKRLPFSMMVPRLFHAVKEFITKCYQFSENLDSSSTEREDMLFKATNLLFTGSMKDCTAIVLRNMHNNLLQLIQFSINMDELQLSCVKLEEHIHQLVSSLHQQQQNNITAEVSASQNNLDPSAIENSSTKHTSSVPRSRLHGVPLFRDRRGEAESLIYVAFHEKINDFFKLASYDWMEEDTGAATLVNMQPQSYMRDLMSYLESTFRSFTNLPPKLAQAACMSSCNHIHKTLLGLVVDSNSPARTITERSLQQVSLDLRECERFAQREPVAGVDSETLQMSFQELRQLLDLVLRDQWELYFNTYNKPNSPFERVRLTSAIKVIEKMREADKKRSTSFFQAVSLKKSDREKRRRLDDILKQLKELQILSASQNS